MGDLFKDLLINRMEENNARELKELKETLLSGKKNGYDRMPAAERGAMNAYCEDYKAYLDAGKTERECVAEGIRRGDDEGIDELVGVLQKLMK